MVRPVGGTATHDTDLDQASSAVREVTSSFTRRPLRLRIALQREISSTLHCSVPQNAVCTRQRLREPNARSTAPTHTTHSYSQYSDANSNSRIHLRSYSCSVCMVNLETFKRCSSRIGVHVCGVNVRFFFLFSPSETLCSCSFTSNVGS